MMMELICDIPPARQPQPMLHVLSTIFIHCSRLYCFCKWNEISSANGHYAHKSFIETELSHETDAKKTWLKCQGYEYEPNPAGFAAASRDARQVAVKNKLLYMESSLLISFPLKNI